MNKKVKNKSNSWLIIITILFVILISLTFYFLSNITIWIGIVGLFIALPFTVFSSNSNKEYLFKIGIILLIASFILVVGGVIIKANIIR